MGKNQEYFRFLDSWSIPYKKNCPNSRSNNDIDMELGPVTKIDKRNTATSSKFDDDVTSGNCGVTVIFLIYC